MKREELRIVGAMLGLAVALYVGFQLLGGLTGGDDPVELPAEPQDEVIEEFLVIQVEADGADGWVAKVAGMAFRNAADLSLYIEMNESGGLGLMIAPRSMGGRVAAIAQACLEGGLTRVDTRFVDDPSEDGKDEER